MLLAEMDPDLKGALVGFLVILTLVLQSLYADWRQKKAVKSLETKVDAAAAKVDAATQKAETAATTATALAGKTVRTMEGVHAALNGHGVMGALAEIKAELKAHGVKLEAHGEDDRRQFAELRGVLGVAEKAGG
jgi:aerobic-type carbon monoxide dehydrogenase small subunit (CoxS/CutS family)